MALFQKNAEPSGGTNYKAMSKEQLITLVNTQKNDLETLARKLSEAYTVVNEKNLLAQQVAALSAENEAFRTKAESLDEEIKALARENEALKAKPAAPQSEITEPGSIAEQALRVNRVMEAAQKAADDYLAKIKEMHDIMSREFSDYEISAKQKAEEIIKNANGEAASITQKARSESDEIWNALQSRFDGFVDGKLNKS